MTVNNRIRKWYMAAYPTDDMGEEINPTLTFGKLSNAMHAGKCVYETIGVHDSVIRERVFDMLAKVKKTTYQEVYDLWLNGKRLYQR